MASDQTYHYTQQDIEMYLNGNMTAQEMHAIEKAALNDPFLADAIDGYRLANPSTTAQHLNEITAMIAKPQPDKVAVVPMLLKKNNLRQWAAAATIAGILGLSAWLMLREGSIDQTKSQVAKSETTIEREAVAAVDNTSADTLPVSASVKNQDAPETIHPKTEVPVATPESEVKINISEKKPTPVAKPSFEATSLEVAAAPVAEAVAAQRHADTENKDRLEMAKKSGHEVSDVSQNARSQRSVALSFTGNVTDNEGKPVQGALVESGNLKTVTNLNGNFNFSLPATAGNNLDVDISAAGYRTETATLFAGRTAGIALQPGSYDLNETIVVGVGTRKKTAALGKFKDMKVDTLQSAEHPYPDGGWAHFYDDLSQMLGVDRSRADKLLHLKFYIEDGMPTKFTIVKTPDMDIANKAISAIMKGPRWKNFNKYWTAEVKIKVQ